MIKEKKCDEFRLTIQLSMERIFLDLAVANFVELLMSLGENHVFEPFK